MRIQIVCVAWCAAACAQNITVQVDGKPVGSQSAINFMPGLGIMQVCSNNLAANRVDCRPSFNTALVPTHDSIHANENYCASTNGTTAYTCHMPNKALTGYNEGLTVVLDPDAPCLRSCTIDIDGVGPRNIKRMDGTTDPGGTLAAGQPHWIFFDGKVFRLMSSGAGGNEPAATGQGDRRGDVIARRVIGSMDTMPYAAAISLDVTAGDLHKTLTTPAGGNATVNASTGGLPGQHLWILIANDTVAGKTIAFGTNFRSSGNLVGIPGKASTIQFISDGVAWYEVGRTVGL